MAGLQQKVDFSDPITKPVGKVFSGGGDSARDKELGYYQHGLYFRHDGTLAKEHPYNAEKIALFETLGLNVDEPALEITAPERVPIDPELMEQLNAKSDEDIYAMAMKLVDKLVERRLPNTYEPDVAARDENVRFIATHIG